MVRSYPRSKLVWIRFALPSLEDLEDEDNLILNFAWHIGWHMFDSAGSHFLQTLDSLTTTKKIQQVLMSLNQEDLFLLVYGMLCIWFCTMPDSAFHEMAMHYLQLVLRRLSGPIDIKVSGPLEDESPVLYDSSIRNEELNETISEYHQDEEGTMQKFFHLFEHDMMPTLDTIEFFHHGRGLYGK